MTQAFGNLTLLYCSDTVSAGHGWHSRCLITHPTTSSVLRTSLVSEWQILMGPLSRAGFFVFRCCISYSVPTFLNFIFFHVAIVTGSIISTLIPVNQLSVLLPNKTVQQDYLGENLICQKCMCETVQRLGTIYSPESQFPYSPSYFTTNSYRHWDWLNLQIRIPKELF